MNNKNGFLCDRDGKPIFLTGLQCHNSSTGTEMIDRTIEAIKLHGGNLLEAPVYWCEIEKEKDLYDFNTVAELVDKARKANLYLILLWFGASKNGLFTYTPDYIKKDTKVYKRAKNSEGIPVESLSPHCYTTLKRDKKAFGKVMEFLKEYDSEGTIIAVQVENEVGLVHTDRDYSEEAEIEYQQLVPHYLRDIVIKDSGVEKIDIDRKKRPTWKGIFGRHANEAFCAWKHACYIQEMVEEGKKYFSIPYIMNVSIEINEYEEPALCYVSGGPVARVLEIWKRTAHGITLFGPDIYLPAERDYRKACELYAREDNPLFIPESMNSGIGPALNMLIAVADYDAVGVCCFGAESAFFEGELLPEAKHIAISMRILSSLSPLLVKYRSTGKIHAITQSEFSSWQYIKTPEYHITARFISDDPKQQHYFGSRVNTSAPENNDLMTSRGRCLLVDCGSGEFYISGIGVCLSFVRRPEIMDEIPYAHLSSSLSSQLNFLSIEEGHFEGEKWICEYKRNGDEANYQLYVHPGQVIHVVLNSNLNWTE